MSSADNANPEPPQTPGREPWRRVAFDCFIIFLLASTVIAIAASAPPTTLDYAQTYQIDSVLDAANGGNWLLPHSHTRGLDRKPPLYVWLDAPVVALTGWHNDFIYRVPTVLATFVVAFLIYFLGRRWYDRTVALLASALWLTAAPMGQLTYLAVTDMLFTASIVSSIFFADRLIFHNRNLTRPALWALAFWVTIILGALAKGWGLVNTVLVGGAVLLAAAFRNGFRHPRPRPAFLHRLKSYLVLIFRRWCRAARLIRLPYGLLVLAGILLPVIIATLIYGGDEFKGILYVELWQRITGLGPAPPRHGALPPFGHLLYNQLPACVFAIGAFLLASRRRCFRSASRLLLPACWILAVLTPFSFTHGFRADYLLPCYPAVALMAAWTLAAIARIQPERAPRFRMLRFLIGAPVVLLGVLLLLFPLNVFFHSQLTPEVRELIHIPAQLPFLTSILLAVTLAASFVFLFVAVRALRAWRVTTLVLLAVIGMIPMIFIDRHIHCRQAISLDCATQRDFARAVQPYLGEEPYLLTCPDDNAVPLYLGRWGRIVPPLSLVSEVAKASNPRWLIVSDKSLVEAGIVQPDPPGDLPEKSSKRNSRALPEKLGKVVISSARSVGRNQLGRIYLIDMTGALDRSSPSQQSPAFP